jgi:lipopolysaccharide cholinephosphotransferase
MVLSQTETERYRAILLETLKAFKKVCEDNSLRWWMAFGSAIGTVRHGGFIPWDDDVDVFMPRHDYEKFLKIKVEGYDIVGIRTAGDGEDYPFPYVKFCDGSSTIWERQTYPCVFGVFLDVFPLDETGEAGDAEDFRLRYRAAFHGYKRAQRFYPRGTFLRRLAGGDLRGAVKTAVDSLWYRPRTESLRNAFLEYESQAAQRKGGDLIVYGTSSDYRGMTMPRDRFGETVLMKFEDMEVNMPSGYDAILRAFYGDYMQLPPAPERLSGHYHYFVDLDRRLTLSEAMDRMSLQGKFE